MWCQPGWYAHILSSVVLAIGLALVFVNYKQLLRMNAIHIGLFLLLISIAVVHHGESHLMLEQKYGQDPMCTLLGLKSQ